MSDPQKSALEIFVRYITASKTFEWRIGESAPVVSIKEGDIPQLLTNVRTSPNGAKEAEVMAFLFDTAKRDTEGRWVSASSASPRPGQALVG